MHSNQFVHRLLHADRRFCRRVQNVYHLEKQMKDQCIYLHLYTTNAKGFIALVIMRSSICIGEEERRSPWPKPSPSESGEIESRQLQNVRHPTPTDGEELCISQAGAEVESRGPEQPLPVYGALPESFPPPQSANAINSVDSQLPSLPQSVLPGLSEGAVAEMMGQTSQSPQISTDLNGSAEQPAEIRGSESGALRPEGARASGSAARLSVDSLELGLGRLNVSDPTSEEPPSVPPLSPTQYAPPRPLNSMSSKLLVMSQLSVFALCCHPGEESIGLDATRLLILEDIGKHFKHQREDASMKWHLLSDRLECVTKQQHAVCFLQGVCSSGTKHCAISLLLPGESADFENELMAPALLQGAACSAEPYRLRLWRWLRSMPSSSSTRLL